MTEPKYLIWSNYSLDYEDWREDLEAEYPELSEQEREEKMYERNGEYLDDERMNLDIQLDKPILVIVDLGLWNGRYSGYKEIKSGNIKDCLSSECDYVTCMLTSWVICAVMRSTMTVPTIISIAPIRMASAMRRSRI